MADADLVKVAAAAGSQRRGLFGNIHAGHLFPKPGQFFGEYTDTAADFKDMVIWRLAQFGEEDSVFPMFVRAGFVVPRVGMAIDMGEIGPSEFPLPQAAADRSPGAPAQSRPTGNPLR